MKGKFITFEGCEGSGKSTQVDLFKEYLEKNKIDYYYTREPGGTPISEKIRELILDINNKEMAKSCEALLYAAAREQLVNERILPMLDEGKLVICDRYIDSSFAYQAYARGLGYDYIESINQYVLKNCMPMYTIFLDISPDKAFKRKGGMDKDDRLEQAGMEFHWNVYNGYKAVEKKFKDRFINIDSTKTKEEIFLNIINSLKKVGVLS